MKVKDIHQIIVQLSQFKKVNLNMVHFRATAESSMEQMMAG